MSPTGSMRLDDPRGVLYAALAYVAWGLVTIYWKLLGSVPSSEVLAHRIVWCLGLLIIVIGIMGRARHVLHLLRKPKIVGLMVLTAFLIGGNWYLFIWAVVEGRVLETSLGYYINPLVSILLGALLLGERLSRLRKIAFALAATAVAIQIIMLGELPWVSLTLAFSFGAYGYLRKVAPVEALEGLFIETLVLAPLAVAWLMWVAQNGTMAFGAQDMAIDLLLIGAGPVTAVPLLLFSLGARMVRLSTMGFLQYIAPTISFLLAVCVWHEPFGPVRAATFALIWAALALVSWEAVANERRFRARRAVANPD